MAARRKRSPVSAPAASPPTLPPPRFVAPVPDSPVELQHPIEYAGRTYATIIRRRPSSGVLGRWFEQFDADAAPQPGEPHLNVPIFIDEAGELIPDAVLGFLDDDDKQRVYEGTDPFLPARLMVALEALTQELPPSTGGPAELTSSVSSAAAAPNSTP
ncbi:hypothetical protein [Methylobacterium sp. CCH5-D2]|uniref:hypothetical protein n=1 Tax=Methylobacterium sp. CCH5-D2 TaxID=1768765 RepID=UPI000830C261|nr:hypothetical protein [Methylobacterium sp. CCH5-D2]